MDWRVALVGCVTSGATSSTPPIIITPETAQNLVDQLDTGWAIVQGLADTAVILKPEVAGGVERAMAIAAPVVRAARLHILAAGSDMPDARRALTAGLAAISTLREVLTAARAKVPPG